MCIRDRFELCRDGKITAEDALRSADSENNLRLKIKLEGAPARRAAPGKAAEESDTDLLVF